MSLVILVPMLGRPHHVAPLLESIREATPNARVKWLLTEGDKDVIAEVWRHVEREMAADLATAADVEEFPPRERGDYAHKINQGVMRSLESYIFTGASDLRFHPGWYEAALAKMTPGIGVVGTNDLGNLGTRNGGHATHFLVARWYAELGTIDEPGKFFHEGYWHEVCDNEAYETAKSRRMYAHARDSIVEHLHPLWGKGEWDSTYGAMRQRIDEGWLVFRERRKLWR